MWQLLCFIITIFADFAPYRYAHHVTARLHTGRLLLMYDDARERRVEVKPGWYIIHFHDGTKAAITPGEFHRLYVPFAGDEYYSKITFWAHEAMSYGKWHGQVFTPGDRLLYVWSDGKFHRHVMNRREFIATFVQKAF